MHGKIELAEVQSTHTLGGVTFAYLITSHRKSWVLAFWVVGCAIFIIESALGLDPAMFGPNEGLSHLTYAAADKVQFRYRLDGIDRDWFEAGQRRSSDKTHFGLMNFSFRVQIPGDPFVDSYEPNQGFTNQQPNT
jgi:hypothetical protein